MKLRDRIRRAELLELLAKIPGPPSREGEVERHMHKWRTRFHQSRIVATVTATVIEERPALEEIRR